MHGASTQIMLFASQGKQEADKMWKLECNVSRFG